jgi:hypothetical protein
VSTYLTGRILSSELTESRVKNLDVAKDAQGRAVFPSCPPAKLRSYLEEEGSPGPQGGNPKRPRGCPYQSNNSKDGLWPRS